MQDIDEKIRLALTVEDQKAIDEIDRGAGLFEMIGMSFKGKQAWMMYYVYFMGFAVFVALLYFVTEYLNTTDMKTSLTWALAIITCLFMLTLIKIIGWQQMLKMELLREIKRLEMRIMLLVENKHKHV